MYQPDFNAISGLIGQLNNDELKQILNDDAKFEDLLKDFEQLKAFEKDKEMILASNRSLAEYNLSKEPALIESRERGQELAEKGQQLYKIVEEKINELKTKSGTVSLEDAYNSLQVKASNKEEESEALFQHFLSNDLDVEQFIEDFTIQRKAMHIVKVKVDKMKELMTRRPSLPPVSPNYVNAHIPGNVSNFYPPYSNPTPYPSGPGIMNMPMPSLPGAYRNHF